MVMKRTPSVVVLFVIFSILAVNVPSADAGILRAIGRAAKAASHAIADAAVDAGQFAWKVIY